MGKTSGRRAQPEHYEQVMLMQWAEAASGRTPELGLLFAIPNGGHRDVRTAARLKVEGVKAGVPDLCLPVARGGYHGLWIEMKAGPTSRVQPSQREWHAALRAQGYAVRVAFGWESARRTIERYLASTLAEDAA
jgi:hypothetical protein